MDTPQNDWRQQIEAVIGAEGVKLARFALEFLATEHAERAIALSWTEVELFGLHHDDKSMLRAIRQSDFLVSIFEWSRVNTNAFTPHLRAFSLPKVIPERLVRRIWNSRVKAHSREKPAVR